jgi:CheY-like chemotaxis protein
VSEAEELPREVLMAWVQFLRGDITEAVNALNNRLNVIAVHASMEEHNLSDEQRHVLEQIRTEVGRAAKITAGLLRKVTAMAPDSAPAVIHKYDGSSLGTANILLVEDDDANRAVIKKLFERLGQSVTAVTNGLDAYEVLRGGEVDCVISDVRLPFAGGRTLFEQVEQNLPHLASRFVFVTGDYTNPESREFLDQTGQPVVGKPYELDTLLGAVATILHKGPR